jgi:hypothetical protein
MFKKTESRVWRISAKRSSCICSLLKIECIKSTVQTWLKKSAKISSYDDSDLTARAQSYKLQNSKPSLFSYFAAKTLAKPDTLHQNRTCAFQPEFDNLWSTRLACAVLSLPTQNRAPGETSLPSGRFHSPGVAQTLFCKRYEAAFRVFGMTAVSAMINIQVHQSVVLKEFLIFHGPSWLWCL